MRRDSGIDLKLIKVDGGATTNDTLMQLQADILGVTVVRPSVAETTALGAAYAAGISAGFWSDLEDVRRNWQEDRRFEAHWDEDRRERGYLDWKRAVERSLDWARPRRNAG